MGCMTWIRGLKITFSIKDKELNKIAAFFNFSTFLLTCAALVQPSWFRIKGLHCSQSLSLAQFFTFDEDDDDNDDSDDQLRQSRIFDPINRSDFNAMYCYTLNRKIMRFEYYILNINWFFYTTVTINITMGLSKMDYRLSISVTEYLCIAVRYLGVVKILNMPKITKRWTSLNLCRLPPCTTPEIITLMRILILLCFMVLLCSCIGVIINITSLNSKAIKMLRRNAVPSIMCVFWVIAIVGVCYYTTVVLGNANNSDPNTIQVDYEYGFYTITGAGALALLASAANLWGAPLSNDEDIQRRNLMEDWDGYEAHSVGPTPAVPTLPPYTPSANYVPTAHPTFAPPVLGTQQYFPFDDLSILPPPPPYTP